MEKTELIEDDKITETKIIMSLGEKMTFEKKNESEKWSMRMESVKNATFVGDLDYSN